MIFLRTFAVILCIFLSTSVLAFEVTPPGTVGDARLLFGALEHQGIELGGTSLSVISGPDAVGLMADDCPGYNGNPFNYFTNEIDSKINYGLENGSIPVVMLKTDEGIFLYLDLSNTELAEFSPSVHVYIGGSICATQPMWVGYLGDGCDTCRRSSYEAGCIECAVVSPIVMDGDDILLRDLDVGTILPNWEY